MPQAREHVEEIAGFQTIVVGDSAPDCLVVMLHGYAMEPASFAPFAHSLRAGTRYFLPRGQHRASNGGYAWWPIDPRRREASLNTGPRDLADELAPGREQARALLCRFLQSIAHEYPTLPLILAGFSQGGMLACDARLFEPLPVRALALMSASRIAMVDWQPRLRHLRGLPVFISHGANDPDLAFSAGQALRECLQSAGAAVTWVPFTGGHETPLQVWREFRKFIANVLTRQA